LTLFHPFFQHDDEEDDDEEYQESKSNATKGEDSRVIFSLVYAVLLTGDMLLPPSAMPATKHSREEGMAEGDAPSKKAKADDP